MADHKKALNDLQNDPQQVLDENFTELIDEFSLDSVSIRATPEDFCGFDILEQDFVFDKVAGHERIISHCLSHISKGEALRENGAGTSTALEVFVPLFRPLFTQKGRCSAIVTGDDAFYLDYIGLLADIVADGSAFSRYCFLRFRARRLFLKTIFRMNKKPKQIKKIQKA